MRAILSLFLVLLFVASCGGGSDSGTMVEEIPEEVEMKEEPVEMGYTENDCYYHTEQEIVDFLLDNRRGHLVNRWLTSPVVYIDYGTSEQNVRLAREALEEINAIIPDEYDVGFGGIREMELIPHTDWPYGEIVIFFVPFFMDGRFGHASTGYGRGGPEASPTFGEVVILEELPEPFNCETVMRQVIAHELLHTLGFNHTVNSPQWIEHSIMTPDQAGGCGNELIDGVLGTMDKDAIRAVYSLENATRPEEFMADESHCE